ncbi:oxysterol-binding protein-related protein 1/2 [Paragonimus westermani]|uniref:Oxysterol-binding protein-related protein 1/2 n=1 Tax=Paragonimus westermani TaxID=34504 RepID=A0A5J4NFX9_9TREM|nr:oxysterol-binding protein-related protein 1/2 [Paragonimus westermani]
MGEEKCQSEEDFEKSCSLGRDFSWMSRTQLPAVAPKTDFSVWSFVKQCIGKDLTKISMPVALNEPLSFLQRIAECMEYSELLTRAVEQPDPIRRMEVCHHPPVTAFHVQSADYSLWSTIQFKLKFWGKSIEVQPKGSITLKLHKYGEVYSWQSPNLTVHNVLIGKLWIEYVGHMQVTNHTTGIVCQLEFHPSGWLNNLTNQVTGQLLVPDPDPQSGPLTPVRHFYGNWTRALFTVDPAVWRSREQVTLPHMLEKQSRFDSTSQLRNSSEPNATEENHALEFGLGISLPEQRCLWMARPRPDHSSDQYNFTLFAIGLNELTNSLRNGQFPSGHLGISEHSSGSSLQSFLPPTDCRFRPDIRALELGDLNVAAQEKNRLEEKQRHTRSLLVRRSRIAHSLPITSIIRLADRDSSSSCSVSGNSRCAPSIHTERQSGSTSSLPIVGPVWFTCGRNEYTDQEEWLFIGDYWSRNWSRCPDLY